MYATATPEQSKNAAGRIGLRKPQKEIFLDPARFKVVVAGRRFGKSWLALVWLIGIALLRPDALCYYVAPTYGMARDIAWALLKRMVPKSYVSRVQEVRLSITFRNGSKIVLKGADNPDSLRGVGLDACVMDEYATMDPRTWTEVIRPALSDKNGLALFIGTPKGFNHFHKLWQDAQDREGWKAWQFTTEQGGNVPPEEIEQAKQDLTDKQYNQEYMASFEALTARVYYAFSRAWNVRDNLVLDPNLDLLVGIDFNVAPGMHAVIGHRVGDQVHVLDEVFIADGNTEEMAREIVRRYGTTKVGGRLIKRGLHAYPDPTGARRQTNAPIGQTDHSILRTYGFKVLTPYAPYAMEDKHNTTNAGLRTAAGRTKVFIHPACKRLISALEGFTFKEDTGTPDKSGGLDHITDAFAYLICMELPMEKSVVKDEAWV